MSLSGKISGASEVISTPERSSPRYADRSRDDMVVCHSIKLCECGCGTPTGVSSQTRLIRGHVKGQPVRFIIGHNSRTGKSTGYLAKNGPDGKMLAHVLVAENALGKRLPVGAQVHHVDGNKQNNRNDNLVICPNQGYHSLLHIRQRVLAAGGDPNTQRICGDCQRLKFAFELVTGKFQCSNHCKQCKRERNLRDRRAKLMAESMAFQ